VIMCSGCSGIMAQAIFDDEITLYSSRIELRGIKALNCIWAIWANDSVAIFIAFSDTTHYSINVLRFIEMCKISIITLAKRMEKEACVSNNTLIRSLFKGLFYLRIVIRALSCPSWLESCDSCHLN